MEIQLILTAADYEAALKRIAELMSADFGTPDGDELSFLTTLIEGKRSSNGVLT